MLIFLLFAVVNLSVGFAAAVLLGYGPQPWYALILPSKRDNVIQIDAIDSEEEAETENPVAADPPAEATSNVVTQPFPEMNEPEDTPAEPEPVAESAPKPDPVPEPESEPKVEQEVEPVAEATEETEEDNDLEEYLAGRKEETQDFEKEESAAEIASADDIESMFAATETTEDESAHSEEATAEEESSEEDKALDQDDIAALFNS